MIDARRPISFIATSMPDAAEVFYTDVMGLTLQEASPYALVFADGAQMLRVQIVEGFVPAQFTVHGWQVSNIEGEIAKLSDRGVTFLTFAHISQDALGIWTTPDGHKIAWFKDPSGNMLSLSEFVET